MYSELIVISTDLHTVLAGQLDTDRCENDVAAHHLPTSGPRWGAEQLVELAGAGTPLMAEFAMPELAVALGMSTPAPRRLVGDALELRHRLPLTWARVRAGELPLCRPHHCLKTHGGWSYHWSKDPTT